ncbi:hypothetical protein [Luteolibacter sp. AS25]|uniref:hypothetical protein n=1 Tax=Luteolibacter sp. AS25 TaxID=3135776 RepID=UPI00398A6EAB
MTSSNTTALDHLQLFKGGLVVVSVSALLTISIFSQSADIFDNEDVAEANTETAGQVSKVQATQPVEANPSRFAGADIEPYVASRIAIFSMRNRPVDPFGLNQDPNIKPALKQAPSRLQNQRQPALPPIPLVDIVKLIDITAIIPRERKFLVGTRTFKEGSVFPLEFRGKKFSMKILKVTAGDIIFQDLTTQEVATRSTNILPPGMIPGGEKMTPPGMVSPDTLSPLKLEANSSFDPSN